MESGDTIIRADIALTIVFGVTATFAAASFSTFAQWVGALTAMTLFAIGVVAFIWSFWRSVQLSRTYEIAVTQLYLLMGSAIPAPVRRTMSLALLTQFVIAFASTLARPDGPDGRPGSSLAVGFLVPMLGFGLNGLWASHHGNFEIRTDTGPNVPPSDPEIRQNAHHG